MRMCSLAAGTELSVCGWSMQGFSGEIMLDRSVSEVLMWPDWVVQIGIWQSMRIMNKPDVLPQIQQQAPPYRPVHCAIVNHGVTLCMSEDLPSMQPPTRNSLDVAPAPCVMFHSLSHALTSVQAGTGEIRKVFAASTFRPRLPGEDERLVTRVHSMESMCVVPLRPISS